jgi:hypothetical protein
MEEHHMEGQQPNPHDRRAFLRTAGFSGAALMLAACAGDASRLLSPGTPRLYTVGAGGTIVLDFSTDIDVLNYAYALEQLEAAFYNTVVANPAFPSIFAANEQRVLRDVRDHEVAHRDFFAAALDGAKIPNLTPDFSGVNFADGTSVLTTARTFEDLGVSAYNGAGRYLRNSAYLTIAGKIVSVEARHASAIRDLLQPRTGAFAPQAFDPANPPSTVLAAADPFIVENITVINA